MMERKKLYLCLLASGVFSVGIAAGAYALQHYNNTLSLRVGIIRGSGENMNSTFKLLK